MKERVLVFGLGVMTAAAIAGWAYRPSAGPALMPLSYQAPAGMESTAVAPAATTAAVYTESERPAPVRVRRAARRYQEPVRQAEPELKQRAPMTSEERAAIRQDDDRGEVRQRSTGKSVAIVAGSAAAGAAIGGMTGGGKGAAIGALSGGAAGYVYDRMTHKKNDKIFPW